MNNCTHIHIKLIGKAHYCLCDDCESTVRRSELKENEYVSDDMVHWTRIEPTAPVTMNMFATQKWKEEQSPIKLEGAKFVGYADEEQPTPQDAS